MINQEQIQNNNCDVNQILLKNPKTGQDMPSCVRRTAAHERTMSTQEQRVSMHKIAYEEALVGNSHQRQECLSV